MQPKQKSKIAEPVGVTAVIIKKNKLLLAKRRNLPFIANPGIWTFIAGARGRNEDHLDAAYREIAEEIGLERRELKLIAKPQKVRLFDAVRKNREWIDVLFVFKTDSSDIKLNFENREYRWATMSDIEREHHFTNTFVDKKRVIERIKAAMKK